MISFKTQFFLSVIAGILAVGSANASMNLADTVLVCRSRQCAPAEKMMTREFLYNQLGSMLQNNINQSILFCDADPNVRVCLNDRIGLNVLSGVTNGTLEIPGMTLLDAKACPDFNGYTFVSDYKLSINGTYPECQASLNKMAINAPDDITIQTPGFECRFTENGITVMNASYVIDYVDFDYGILGAYYTMAVGQVSKGGRTGYMLMRFKSTSNDMNEMRGGTCCECDSSQIPPCQCEPEEPEVIVQEKVVTEYEVAPIEVTIKTKAPIEAGMTQDIRVNGVDVKGVPIVTETSAQSSENNVKKTIRQVEVTSNKENL